MFFRQFRAQTESTAEMFQQTIEIPPAYMDLIAALTQDSEEPLTVLIARINDTLSPFARNEKGNTALHDQGWTLDSHLC